MSQSNPTPTPTPAPQKRGLFNAKQLAELDESDAVILAARKAEYAPILLLREITPALVEQLATKTQQCRDLLTASKSQHGGSKSQTQLAREARDEVIGLLQEIQSAARQKLGADSPQINSTYYGSTNLRESRSKLTQAYDGIQKTLETVPLPGITPAFIADLTAEFAAYENALDGKTTGAGGGSTDYQQALDLLAEVTKERQTIQFAANGAFPVRDKSKREDRKAFQIPPDQNFVG